MNHARAPDGLLKIATDVKRRLGDAKRVKPLERLREECSGARRPHNFLEPFSRTDAPQIIAEVKLASPSEGDIAPNLDPVAGARDYLGNGAAALSILTEQDHFKGSLATLARVRRENPSALLLRKDFIVEEYQLLEALANGADAVLLIVALLGGAATHDLLFRSLELGLTPLVEVHDEAEMREAVAMRARLVGVNNRNLQTMKTSLETSERLAALAGPNQLLIAESGLSTGDDIQRLRRLGFRGFLIGTHFMKTPAPGAALKNLVRDANKGFAKKDGP